MEVRPRRPQQPLPDEGQGVEPLEVAAMAANRIATFWSHTTSTYRSQRKHGGEVSHGSSRDHRNREELLF